LAEFFEYQIEQGATWSNDFTLTDVYRTTLDLTPYTVRAQLRKSYYAKTAVDFDVSTDTTGTITMELSAESTSNLRPGRYVFDVIAEDSEGVVIRLIEGIATVIPSATKR
jgi:hypothetical protein